MTIKDRLSADLKEAMKSGDALRRTSIRNVMAAIKEAEQRKRENLGKQALKKHNVQRPANEEDPEAMAAYQRAVSNALAAEGVEAASALHDDEVLDVIRRLVKQRRDSIADAQRAGRADILQAEQQELALLESYLPKLLSRQEIEVEAREVIAQVGASSPRDMGKVMGPLMQKLQGHADGQLVSAVVRELLGS